jgi:RNA polymerase-interacting CarD/CdnL/TRCF family regulator
MDFNPGDCVVHPKFGVGTVETIEEKRLTENEPSLFYRVDFVKTRVWVPVMPHTNRGLRPITARKELLTYQNLLKSPPVLLNDDFRKRQTEIEERLGQGTFRMLCEVVRDLTARAQKRPLSNHDTALLNRAREALIQEWSMAKGITPQEAVIEIDGFLRSGREKA